MRALCTQAVLVLALAWSALAHAQSTAAPGGMPASAPAIETATADAGRVAFRIRPADDAWRVSLPRDAEAATQAYLDRLPADSVQRSNDYFEGGYWLQLWDFLIGLAFAALVLHGARSARVRDWAQRVGRRAFFRDALYGAVYALAGWVFSLPLTVYQGFVREHHYGMATQQFPAWMGEQFIALLVTIVMTAVAVGVLYAVIRRSGERWWLWGTVASVALLAVMVMIGPVFVDPLFNTYKAVEDGPVKETVLAMAHSNGVPADKVYEFDASRQTTRVSANVSGFMGTAAIRLNDNLLRRASLPEIRAVMSHEIGHYVMNHLVKMMLQFGVLILTGFLFAQWAMKRLFERFGTAWGTRSVGDVASLPLLAAAFSVFMFFCTPLVNTIIRTQEVEADRFGLNLSREPHGFAEAMLKLAEYRKVDPGPAEEFIFFHHPSARSRIHDAMRWREAMNTP
ncbi:MAG: M48 family metallopeptidase [Piscinibacter sp.]|nr:M48 family metallopeptidase [Piscinibacter sp.]